MAAIRRPGRRHTEEPRWRWALADARPGHESLRWGEVDGPVGYAEIPLDGSAGIPSADPLVAVCAHGKHDQCQCCAVRGRSAAARIADRYPEATWECSHLGGDRFAATMLILPHGLFYGRVDQAEDPADIVTRYTEGRVDERYLRGRSSHSAAVQSAQHHARAVVPDDRIDAFAPVRVVERDEHVEVTLEGPRGPVEVWLRETYSEPIFPMCRAHAPGPVRQWELVSIPRALRRLQKGRRGAQARHDPKIPAAPRQRSARVLTFFGRLHGVEGLTKLTRGQAGQFAVTTN